MIFDSHTHYYEHQFDSDRHALLSGLPERGVTRCMVCAVDMDTCAQSLRLAEQYPALVVTAVGVHPETPDAPADYLDRLREYAKHPSVKAIGEIGLDYHYEGYDRDLQHRLLREQISLSKELDLPVILHCRDAVGDMLEILREYAPLSGVMHCFPGSAETAREVLGLGLYIGFTGVITFKNAKKPLAALRSIPADRLLVETDCPYMAPVPYRGKRCDSSMLTETLAVMAREKDIPYEEMCRITAENAAKLFRVDLQA